MRVKIGNTWYEATADQPIMVELTDWDKNNISRMSLDNYKYAMFYSSENTPIGDDYDTVEKRKAWMET